MKSLAPCASAYYNRRAIPLIIMVFLFPSVFFLFSLLPLVFPLILDVEVGKTRCLQEVLSKHDLVKGGYKLINSPTEGERSGFLVRVGFSLASQTSY